MSWKTEVARARASSAPTRIFVRATSSADIGSTTAIPRRASASLCDCCERAADGLANKIAATIEKRICYTPKDLRLSVRQDYVWASSVARKRTRALEVKR